MDDQKLSPSRRAYDVGMRALVSSFLFSAYSVR